MQRGKRSAVIVRDNLFLTNKGNRGGDRQKENCQKAKREESPQIASHAYRQGFGAEKALEETHARGEESQKDRKENAGCEEGPKKIVDEISEKNKV